MSAPDGVVLHGLRRDYVAATRSMLDGLVVIYSTDPGTYCGAPGFVAHMDPDGGLSGVTCHGCRAVITAEEIVRA